MSRRTVAAAVTCLGLWFASGAGAQTSTTSSSSTSTTASTSTSSTTSTTFPNPCAGQVCTEAPPDAFLSGARGEVRLDRGSYCWQSPAPNAQGHFTALCADVFLRDPDAVLVVTAGETLTLRFGAMSPTAVQFDRDGQVTTLTPGNPVRFVANFAPGTTPVLRFFTRWLQGDAGYSVRLDVRATGRIALTG